MDTDAASSSASSDSFCQTGSLNYYSENPFYGCKLDSYFVSDKLVKKVDNLNKKVDYCDKNIAKQVNNVNKRVASCVSDCYGKKIDEINNRRVELDYFSSGNNNNNNNNNGAVDKTNEINIQLNTVNSFGNKSISFSPDQVSIMQY